MIRQCKECDGSFDDMSPAKRKSGGLITHCPDCSEEFEPKALGFASGDGKMSALSIVKPETVEDGEKLMAYWKKASGMHKGKECQMHNPSLTMPKVSFKTITTASNTNHKGKL